MKRNLPPMLALKVFEAAGRHQSFTRAAAELSVTPGAVSRQIKLLEDHLGCKVFTRLTRQVELTAFGAAYLRSVDASFRMLEEAAGSRAEPTLRISVTQSLANLWLLPRLSEFTERHFDVRVDTSFAPVDLESDPIHAAIRLGRLPGSRYERSQPDVPHEMVKSWRGVFAEHLFDEVLVPVAHPKLFAGGLEDPRRLLEHPLVHVTSRPHAWRDWLRLHDLDLPPRRGPEYGHFYLALEAARAGKGIAIAPTVFLDGYLGHGQLRCLFPTRIKSAGAYYLLYRERDVEDRRIQTLKRWLVAERSKKPRIGTRTKV